MAEQNKWENFKQAVRYKASEVGKWINRNQTVLIAVVPAVITGATATAGIISKTSRHKSEKKLKERMVYDRNNGFYLETKRKLRNDELVYINKRHQEGETIADILDDMRLLK